MIEIIHNKYDVNYGTNTYILYLTYSSNEELLHYYFDFLDMNDITHVYNKYFQDDGYNIDLNLNVIYSDDISLNYFKILYHIYDEYKDDFPFNIKNGYNSNSYFIFLVSLKYNNFNKYLSFINGLLYLSNIKILRKYDEVIYPNVIEIDYRIEFDKLNKMLFGVDT